MLIVRLFNSLRKLKRNEVNFCLVHSVAPDLEFISIQINIADVVVVVESWNGMDETIASATTSPAAAALEIAAAAAAAASV